MISLLLWIPLEVSRDLVAIAGSASTVDNLMSRTSNGMDSKTIKHVASLARIKLTSEEEENNKKELSSIINYIEQLNKVNTDKVEPLYQTTGLVNSMREDEERGVEIGGGLNEKLIKQSPNHENGFVKVGSVLSK